MYQVSFMLRMISLSKGFASQNPLRTQKMPSSTLPPLADIQVTTFDGAFPSSVAPLRLV